MAAKRPKEQRPATHAEPDGAVGACPPRLLLAEDDEAMRELLMEAFTGEGYEVTGCKDGLELLSRLYDLREAPREPAFDLVVSDIRIPGLTALEILEGLGPCGLLPPILLITAFGDEETHVVARALGVYAVLDKPFELDQLITKAGEALGR